MQNKTKLIYLIGINIDSSEEQSKDDAKIFALAYNMKFISISSKNEDEIKKFLGDLLECLEKEEINKISQLKIKNKIIKDSYKVIFVGSSGAGAKSSLINAIMGDKFDLYISTTCTCSYSTKVIKLKKKKKIVLHLWDTIGQVHYRELTMLFLKDSDCVVLGFDVTNKESFEEIKDWFLIAKEKTEAKLMYLIGNKIDLNDERKISENDARNLAKEYNLRYFETSCKLGIGIQNFVDDLAKEIIKY